MSDDRQAPQDPAARSGSVVATGEALVAQRRPYEKPAVVRLGSVKDLTFGARGGPFTDAPSGMKSM